MTEENAKETDKQRQDKKKRLADALKQNLQRRKSASAGKDGNYKDE